MGIREQIKNEILAKADRAADEVEFIQTSPDAAPEDIIAAVHRYVCWKFFLDPEETAGMSLNEMAELSIDRALEMHLPMAKESERATTCGMAGSAPMKIALLLNALRKDLDLKVSPHRLGLVIDTAELGNLIAECRISR